jgi:2-dehydropantoate 2-reductase
VLGAGAVGCALGAVLAQNGHSPVLVTNWEEHRRALNDDGLEVTYATGSSQKMRVSAVSSAELRSAEPSSVRVAYIAADSAGTEHYAQILKRVLMEDGVVISVQNGLNEELIAELLGPRRVIGGVSLLGAVRPKPGRVHISTPWANLVIGELGGSHTSRIESLSKLTSGSGWTTDVSNNILGVIWSKLIVNAMLSTAAVIWGQSIGELCQEARTRDVMLAIAREGADVAIQLGIELERLAVLDLPRLSSLVNTEPELAGQMLVEYGKLFPNTRPACLQSMEAGKATELPFLIGHLILKGANCGIPVPVMEQTYAIAQRIERGEPRRRMWRDTGMLV